jgi:hypothetical protein
MIASITFKGVANNPAVISVKWAEGHNEFEFVKGKAVVIDTSQLGGAKQLLGYRVIAKAQTLPVFDVEVTDREDIERGTQGLQPLGDYFVSDGRANFEADPIDPESPEGKAKAAADAKAKAKADADAKAAAAHPANPSRK